MYVIILITLCQIFLILCQQPFLQLLGDERYKQFELDGNFDDQIMVVETDIIFKFEK